MTKPKKATPSFFKIMIGDFTYQMSLPPAFVRNFNGRSLIGKSISIKGPTTKNWAVKVEENDNRLYFTNGWQNFVKDHSLNTGDFLVFKYNGNSKFYVKIFDKSACEKFIYLPKMKDSGRATSPDVKTEHCRDDSENTNKRCRKGQGIDEKANKPKTMSSSEFKSENPCFIRTCSESKSYFTTIPKKLAVENGLFKRKMIELVDPSGKSWIIKVRVRDGRLNLQEGWSDFWRANQIAKGDTLIFELTRPSVIWVHAFRGEGKTPIKAKIFEAAGSK